jgi:hypothetical protein
LHVDWRKASSRGSADPSTEPGSHRLFEWQEEPTALVPADLVGVKVTNSICDCSINDLFRNLFNYRREDIKWRWRVFTNDWIFGYLRFGIAS